MDILLSILITWLAESYNFEINETPNVEIRTEQEIRRMYGSDAYALYNRETQTIYILDTVDLESTEGISALVHEMVHHYQNISGAMDGYSCVHESERLAYKIQIDYILEYDGVLMDELDPFNITMKSICNDLGY